METICRAITFINYHIPLAKEQEIHPHYSTLGFFDGMFSEKLIVDYENGDLLSLWRYNVRKTAESRGKFSYQNIFCFSQDSWNQCTDEAFWETHENFEYPLLFVTFLQLRDYMANDRSIEEQCRNFNKILFDNLEADGKYYVYNTIDKNDFVICIRCRDHSKALNAIKKLHNTESGVVHSYSVLSIFNEVLDDICESKYPYLFQQYIDSICLKGITNSFDPSGEITLDQRYYEFCTKLIDKLYPSKEDDTPGKERDYRIYDILGDDDFRLIVRNVQLGRLLREFGTHGQLGDYQGNLRFYLYSSSLLLNTRTPEPPFGIDPATRCKTLVAMDESMKTPLCECLSKEMPKIIKTLKDDEADEKKIVFCQALWQLLQSLKVLESAPAKRYDFYSLYPSFASLVRILESKMDQKALSSNCEIYEFIQKISMTLHGTLRTDIQFFQIRDFNVIVHYAPAKLRAFYAIWALKLTEFYNSFEITDKKYSFIVSPEGFGETHVKQLFEEYAEPEKLMLITVPERNLYMPRWLSVIIAHEVSHCVGGKIRERSFRHEILLRITAHIAALEMQRFWYIGMPEDLSSLTAEAMKSTYLRNRLKDELVKADKECCAKHPDQYAYHSGNSKRIICKDYRSISRLNTAQMIIYAYGEELKEHLLKKRNLSSEIKQNYSAYDIIDTCNERADKMLVFFRRFQQELLPQLIDILHFICKETFADIIAILSLSLSPVEYIKSFIRSDYVKDSPNQIEDTIHILPLRIAVTMEAVETILYRNASWLDIEYPEMTQEWLKGYAPNLREKWRGNVFTTTLLKLKSTSAAQTLMLKVYAYRTGLVSKKKKIQNYIGIYNPAYEDETFSAKCLDFLNDINIYKLLCLYMNQCADTYFEQLKTNENLKQMWEELLETYKPLKSESLADIIQMIEGFLQKYEKACRPK